MRNELSIAYQDWVRRMWNWQEPGEKLKRLTQRDDRMMELGLGGETGEVLELIKKFVRSKANKIDKAHLTEELGDVLYYVMMIGSRYGISMNDIIFENVKKLEGRKAKHLKKRKRKS